MKLANHYFVVDGQGVCLEEVSHWWIQATPPALVFSMRNGASVHVSSSDSSPEQNAERLLDAIRQMTE